MGFRLAVVSGALALAGCGWGNFSNKDLDFYAALPVKEDLESKLPQGAAGQALQQALNAGDRSDAYEGTRTGSKGFNDTVNTLLLFVDAVREYPPTKRLDEDTRLWGPFPDDKHKGIDVQVIMRREAAQKYSFAFQMRNKAAGIDFTNVFTGTFESSDKAGRGHGEFALGFKAMRDVGVPPDSTEAAKLATLSVKYNLDSFPSTVDALVNTTEGSAAVSYRELADKSGSMSFELKDIEQKPDNPGVTGLKYSSFWLANGAGAAELTVTQTLPLSPVPIGRMGKECWDARFNVVFTNSPTNPGQSGDESLCVARPAGL